MGVLYCKKYKQYFGEETSRRTYNSRNFLSQLVSLGDWILESSNLPTIKGGVTPSERLSVAFDKIDNLEYIDQATPIDTTALKSKGYQTIDTDLEPKVTSKLGSSAEDDVFRTPSKQKNKIRPKLNGGKKKGKKDKVKPAVSPEVPESVGGEGGTWPRKDGSKAAEKPPSKEGVRRVQTVTTDIETTKIVTTTTSLNRYTFMKLMDEDQARQLRQDKKFRTHSCSSIPYDNIIENLAPLGKGSAINEEEDEKEKEKEIKDKETLTREEIRPIVESILDTIVEMAVEIIEKNHLQLERINPDSHAKLTRIPSDYKSRIRCNTGDTLSALYIPKIIQTPSNDNLIDARNFVEEYEEYHESCSEMQDTQLR
ncbi:hypothetical protein NQ317_005165 [Molorchus minor]|uniref:Uncharacterized protein n=1 Tax=Molorchus minor TaxID=1323400 RepID=A0ABQ9K0E9_9CUCU|nr:hypothetical protein NQ317_005165 [Molorchus minor]